MTAHSQTASWKKALLGMGLTLVFPVTIAVSLIGVQPTNYELCGARIGECVVHHQLSTIRTATK